MDDKALVFISCGQCPGEETALGKAVVELVNGTPGLKAYFAENQASVAGVAEHILKALDRAAGFIAIMHHRGEVTTPSGTHTRASVWIEQEIAIVSFLQATREGDIPIAAYAQKGIHREGLRDKIMLNPVSFTTNSEVLADLRRVLPTWSTEPSRPPGPRVHVDVAREKDERASNAYVHQYYTKITIRNDGKKAIRNYVAVLLFPRQFVMPNVTYGSEVKNHPRSDPNRIFREEEKNGEALLPTETRRILHVTYQINDDLHDKLMTHPELGELPVSVKVFVDDEFAGEASRPFKDMQNF
jgi:hypothetical protein